MAAINSETNIPEYVGQVIAYDVEEYEYDIMYFIIYEPGPIFKKIYVAQWIGNLNINHSPSVIYSNITVDAPEFYRTLFKELYEVEQEFKRTIKKYRKCTELREGREVAIVRGKHRNSNGYLHKVNDNYCEVICVSTGETLHCRTEYLIVINPKTYVTGTVACLDCKTIFNGGVGMTWVRHLKRPVCNMCVDRLMDDGILSFNRAEWNQLEGPFVYEEDQSKISCRF